jgi:RES domain-containing protein
VILWRIAAETRTYQATDLTGEGAARYPGRWNDAGERVVYAAPTVAMATLETAAHVDDAGLPLDRFLVRIDVPDLVWSKQKALGPADLPATWCSIPAGSGSVGVGSKWIQSASSAVMLVPSVIVPEEPIVLINPLHPDAKQIAAVAVRRFEYSALFR